MLTLARLHTACQHPCSSTLYNNINNAMVKAKWIVGPAARRGTGDAGRGGDDCGEQGRYSRMRGHQRLRGTAIATMVWVTDRRGGHITTEVARDRISGIRGHQSLRGLAMSTMVWVADRPEQHGITDRISRMRGHQSLRGLAMSTMVWVADRPEQQEITGWEELGRKSYRGSGELRAE